MRIVRIVYNCVIIPCCSNLHAVPLCIDVFQAYTGSILDVPPILNLILVDICSSYVLEVSVKHVDASVVFIVGEKF